MVSYHGESYFDGWNHGVMGSKSQVKGASGEREFCKVLGDLIGIDCLERNLEQRRSGGHDIQINPAVRSLMPHEIEVMDRLGCLAIEIKRHHKATGALIAEWWKQTCQQAGRVSKSPTLAFREDRGRWQIILPCSMERVLSDIVGTVRMDIELFAEHLLAGASMRDQLSDGKPHHEINNRESTLQSIQSNL